MPRGKFEQFVEDAFLVVAIYGCPDLGFFEMHDVEMGTKLLRVSPDGWPLLVVLGIIAGVPSSAVALPLDVEVVNALSEAYVRHIEAKFIETARSLGFTLPQTVEVRC